MINEIRKEIEKENPRSKWGKAVIAYANELLDHLEDQIKDFAPLHSLNGARGEIFPCPIERVG